MIILFGKKKKEYKNRKASNELAKILEYLNLNYGRFSFAFAKNEVLKACTIQIFKETNKFEITIDENCSFKEFKEKLNI